MSKKKSGAVFCAFVAALAVPAIASAENTISQRIAQLQYDGMGLHLWLTGTAKWGASSCPNATFVRITGDTTGRKELLSIILAAKASGQSIRFSGNCHTDPDYFNASYVIVD